MRHRFGIIGFAVIGIAWCGFVAFDLFTATLGGDGSGQLGETYRSLIFWRGLAVALLLTLAYLTFRALTKGDDVQ